MSIFYYFNFKSKIGNFYSIFKEDNKNSFKSFCNNYSYDTGDFFICYLGLGENNFKNYVEKIRMKFKDIELVYKVNEKIKNEVLSYLRGDKKVLNLKPYFLTGSRFEQAVWMKAFEIPYGSTLSYKELSFNVSQIIGKQNSYRAVGNALGKNPLIIIVPCHRIIKSNGEFGYFSSGVEIKKALIGLEKEQKIKKI